MTLTPEVVANTQFSASRFRRGYDEEEVDAFLDEVEAELARLLAENAELRAEVEALRAGGSSVAGRPAERPAAPPPIARPERAGPVGDHTEVRPAEVRVVRTDQAPPAPAPARPDEPERPAVPAAAPAGRAVASAEEPVQAALRTLMLAQKTADEAVAQAQEEADRLLAIARERAGQLESQAQQRVRTLEREAQARSEALTGDLERRRTELEQRVAHLRSVESDYRSRLRAQLEDQLRALDTTPLVGDVVGDVVDNGARGRVPSGSGPAAPEAGSRPGEAVGPGARPAAVPPGRSPNGPGPTADAQPEK